MELRVADNPDKSRYEIAADGEIAGFVEYRLDADDGGEHRDHVDLVPADRRPDFAL